jgi:bacterioferritin-associated ferredoxin
MIRIYKCVCFNQKFSDLKKFSEKNKIKTLDELKSKVLVASKCETCVPYINKMFENGQTEFNEIIKS